MNTRERLGRGDALYTLLTRLPGGDFAGHPACRETDPEIFFPLPGDVRQLAVAREICADCPVQASCREFAIRHGETGVWGGTTENQRRQIRRDRRNAVAQRGSEGVAA
jgi:WhiB family redox-sensing transcriptional regulator